MAGWVPPLRGGRRGSAVRLGRHVVPDREVVLLAERLDELEGHLAERASAERAAEDGAAAALSAAAHDRVARDLELLRRALGRNRLVPH
jgi:hypothetical protein